MNLDDKLDAPIIEMKSISKSFSGVKALSNITFNVYPGEIHCLCGENGAGKSTLMKVLSGAYKPDEGTIDIHAKSYSSLNPGLSKDLGISIVYQENDLVLTMNVVENIFIGNEKANGFGLVKRKEQIQAVKKQMQDIGINIDLSKRIEEMSVSDQQFVKILKALVFEPQILVMDEPTSMFNVEDANKVLQLTEQISKRGISVIYISHYLKEIIQIADRITVIRDGVVVSTRDNQNRDISVADITRDMVGRPVEMFYERERSDIGEVLMEVKDLKLKKSDIPISFHVKKGEILGFAGMVGSGRTEIMRAISGADKFYSGTVLIDGKAVDISNPRKSIKAGIAHITEDRQKLGLMLGESVLENLTLVGLDEKVKGSFINIKKHAKLVQGLIEKLNIKLASVWQEVRYLSGGNQQKVVLGKWLFTKQKIYIFDEPTRGIDVNAKAEFYKQITELTKKGNCILMVSSDLPELISMSDRVMVVRDGEITSELTGDQINEQEIIIRALGVGDLCNKIVS